MGLDTVRIVMEVEEEFDITIRDEDAEKIGTVGQLSNYVMEQLRLKPRVHCPSASGFYRLRRALTECWGIARGKVRPGTRLDDLMPRRRRAASWIALSDRLEFRLPGLRPPGWIAPTVVGVFLASAASLSWMRARSVGLDFETIIGVGLVSSLSFGVALAFVLRTTGTMIPPGCATVGDAARLVGSMTFAPIEPEWGCKEVWDTVRAIVAEQLGFRPEDLKEDTHFVHDLGAD